MTWIKSDSPTFHEDLAAFGIHWQANLPQGAGVFEVNARRLRRHIRLSGLGELTVETGTLEQDITVTPGKINLDGTMVAARAKAKVRTFQSTLDKSESEIQRFSGVVAPGTIRPDVNIEIDTTALAGKLPPRRSNIPGQWAREIDRTFKKAIMAGSFEHNVQNAIPIPRISNTATSIDSFAKAFVVGFTYSNFAAIYNMFNPTSIQDALTKITTSLIANNLFPAIWVGMKKANKPDEKLVFAPTLTYGYFPVDRALAGVLQRYGGGNVVRESRDRTIMDRVLTR